MTHVPYKFEKYMEPNFPVYTACEKDNELLAYAHYHNAAEILFVESGQVQVQVGYNFFECKENDIVFIPPQTIHEVTSVSKHAGVQAVVFDLSILVSNYIQAEFQELFSRYPKFHPIISPNHAYYKEIYTYSMLIFETYNKHTLHNKMQIVSYLMLITSYLIQAYAIADSQTDPKAERLRPVFQYIEEHLKDKIYTSELSSLIYVCDKQLIRLFKSVTGDSPVNYIAHRRIEFALKLLTTTNLSISDIAIQAGFGSANYMNRIFQKKLHISPHTYRNPK